MTANAESRYHTLLQLAAGTRRLDDTDALNMTYTASVAAVDTKTPRASQGSICDTFATSEIAVEVVWILLRALFAEKKEVRSMKRQISAQIPQHQCRVL
jgi:hypothetical protein